MSSFIQGQGKEEKIFEKREKPAKIVSQLNHTVFLSYNGEAMAVPPFGKVEIGNLEKLGTALPKGIFVIPMIREE